MRSFNRPPEDTSQARPSDPGRSVVFLGWDGPTLPRAAALLLDRVALDGVADFRMHRIVLPGARAGRRLLEILIDLAEERGVRLVPPRTLTPGSLPEDLYVLPAPRATTTETNLAWIKALGEAEKEELARFLPRSVRHDGLRDRVQVAAQLVHLHATVAGAGAGFREVARVCARGIAPVEAYRWRFLAALQERALSLLDAAGLADVHQARVQAEPRGPEGVTYWLLGVTELLPATRRLLDGAGQIEEVGALHQQRCLNVVFPELLFKIIETLVNFGPGGIGIGAEHVSDSFWLEFQGPTLCFGAC